MKNSNIICKKCNAQMFQNKLPEYSRKEQRNIKWFYICPKCGATAISEFGIMTYYDADGHLIIRGK